MKILFTEEQIQKRITELGKEIADYYRGKPLTVIAVLNGSLLLTSYLIQKIDYSVWLDCIAVSCYEKDRNTGTITFRSNLKLPLKGRHILLVDDVFDTGFTLKKIMEHLNTQGAMSIRTCVLVNKNIGEKLFTTPDWVGFEAPNQYLIGFGMDSEEEYRNLPYIALK